MNGPSAANVSTISPHAAVTWAIWRPTFRGATLGYLAIRGVVVLRHVRLREAMGAGELVGSLPADGEHLPDLGGADEFHLAGRYRLTPVKRGRER